MGGVALLPYASAITTVAHHRAGSTPRPSSHFLSASNTHLLSPPCAHTHTALLTQSLSLSLPTSPSFGRRSASARTHFTLGTAPVHSPALNLVSCGAARRVRSRYAPARAQSEHRQSGTMTERRQRGKQGEKRNY